MATFPSIEASYPIKKASQPLARTVVFADGYQHRITFGLPQHQNAKQFTFIWKNLSETDSDTIETFLDARGVDGASFTYTVPGESSMSFVCLDWRKQIPYLNRSTITATFRQVFEP